MIHAIDEYEPQIHKSAFIAWNAEVAGQVNIEEDCSIWFSATVRADVDKIEIGKGSNIQDGSTVHVDAGVPCKIGEFVTIGHNAVIHGCTIGNGSLIGMGAVILDHAVIGAESVVGAGALVTQGKQFPPRSLIVGSPARAIRTLSDEDAAAIKGNTELYIQLGRKAKNYREVKRDN